MSRAIYVQARADHVASLASAAPLSAIEELVWNALDADAREVRIDLVQNALGGIDEIRVSDDGSGIDILRAEETFGSLGGSWKMAEGTTTRREHRRLHGRHGCGRFKAFALGTHVAWRTTMQVGGNLLSYALEGDASEPGVFHIEQTSPGPATGTEVSITGVRATADSLTVPGPAVQALAAKFALYLKAYPGVQVWYCGIPVSPVIVQKAVTDYEVRLDGGPSAKLEVIEWRKKFSGKGRIVFCGRDGFTLHERPAGVRSGQPFSYTAYLVGGRFGELAAENALVMDELNPEVRMYLDAEDPQGAFPASRRRGGGRTPREVDCREELSVRGGRHVARTRAVRRARLRPARTPGGLRRPPGVRTGLPLPAHPEGRRLK